MPRALLILPTAGYRTEDFLAAASALDVEVVVATDRRQTIGDAIRIDLRRPELQRVGEDLALSRHPAHAAGVDDCLQASAEPPLCCGVRRWRRTGQTHPRGRYSQSRALHHFPARSAATARNLGESRRA